MHGHTMYLDPFGPRAISSHGWQQWTARGLQRQQRWMVAATEASAQTCTAPTTGTKSKCISDDGTRTKSTSRTNAAADAGEIPPNGRSDADADGPAIPFHCYTEWYTWTRLQPAADTIPIARVFTTPQQVPVRAPASRPLS